MPVETVTKQEYTEEEVTDIDFCSQMGDTRSITLRPGDHLTPDSGSGYHYIELQARRGFAAEVLRIYTKNLFWVSTRKRIDRVPLPPGPPKPPAPEPESQA